MQVVLVMFTAAGERRSFSLTRDVTTIGRRENADLRIPLGDVSRKHCRVTVSGDTVRLDDLGSSNGTLVNHVRVESNQQLHPGDVLQVGPVQFVVQIDGDPADEHITRPTPAAAAEDDFDLLPDAPHGTDDSFAAVLEGLPPSAGHAPAEDEEWDIINDEPGTSEADNDAPNR